MEQSMVVLHEVALNWLIKLLKPGSPRISALETKLYTLGAGMAGERKVLQYLANLNLPIEVLWDVNLQIAPGHHVQIDVLVLSGPRAIIYEAKNIADRLRFESNPNRLDKYDEQGRLIASYDCPILQLQDEVTNLRHWFYHHDIPYEVDGAVVMTGSGLIEVPPVKGKVFRLRQIREHLMAGDDGKSGRTVSELNEMADYIRSHNEPYNPFPIVPRSDIPEGEVELKPFCLECYFPLTRISRRRWDCSGCSWITSDPYTHTLEAWFLLISPYITNQQARDLFGIDRQAATNLLNKYPLVKVGKGRAMKYTWDYSGRLSREKGKVSNPALKVSQPSANVSEPSTKVSSP